MASVKVHGGTRSATGQSLCVTCKNSHIRRGAELNQEMVFCQAVSYDKPHRITYPIVECNDYRDATLPALSEMQKIAWFIRADRRTGRVGFVTSDKADEKMRDEIESPFS